MSKDIERELRALQTYRQHTGKDYVPRSAPDDPASMQDYAMLGVIGSYGDSWSRPSMDLKTKSFISMTVTATLGCEDQLRQHILAAHHTGITKDEVVDWLIHLNSYIGTPRTNSALNVVRSAWAIMRETKNAEPNSQT